MKLSSISGVITGAASGIGRCFALELVRAGAHIVAADIDEDGLDELRSVAKDLPGRIHVQVLDVVREDAVKRCVSQSRDALGHAPNLLVNNAAILRDGLLASNEEHGWIRTLPTSQWKAVIDTNLTGPYYVAREFARCMLEDRIRPALIVNISSVTSAGNPGQSNYAASKAGLDALTRTWALEFAAHGIRVVGIAPGLTDTPMAATVSPAAIKELLSDIPLGRMARPEEIWLGLRFVIECDYFNGRTVAIDGGSSFT